MSWNVLQSPTDEQLPAGIGRSVAACHVSVHWRQCACVYAYE